MLEAFRAILPERTKGSRSHQRNKKTSTKLSRKFHITSKLKITLSATQKYGFGDSRALLVADIQFNLDLQDWLFVEGALAIFARVSRGRNSMLVTEFPVASCS